MLVLFVFLTGCPFVNCPFTCICLYVNQAAHANFILINENDDDDAFKVNK